MLDSDMTEFVTDKNGNVLSLQEMRDFFISGKEMVINTLPGFEDS